MWTRNNYYSVMERIRRNYCEISLDRLVGKCRSAKDTEYRNTLYEEIMRRFEVDVMRACESFVKTDPTFDPNKLSNAIFSAVVPLMRMEKPKFFTRILVEEMERKLDRDAVNLVRRRIYMRQFAHHLPVKQAEDVMLTLDFNHDWDSIADKLRIQPETAKKRCGEAFGDLTYYVEDMYSESDLRERTSGAITRGMLLDN